MKPPHEIVQYKSVTIKLRPWNRADGRLYWRFFRADGSRSAYPDLGKAKEEAKKEAQAMQRGTLDLLKITPDQSRAIRRMLEADPTCSLVDEFLAWHGKRKPRKLASEAIAEFLASKNANKGLSVYNVENLRKLLKDVPEKNLCDIAPSDFPPLKGAPRTRRNKIAAWVTLFRWCQKQGHLPYGEPTAPERIDKPQLVRAVPSTWTPDELQLLLSNVAPQYLGWLALGAYAGFRTEEICPDPKSGKDGLRWEDFAWDRDLILVRPETAKTGRRRVVPILPALKAILEPLRASGRIGPTLPPHTPQKGGKLAETTRLGACVGGWRRNALRHSWISYRAAVVGMEQTAMDAGNSETESRKSYDDAKGRDEADRWFSVQDGSKPITH